MLYLPIGTLSSSTMYFLPLMRSQSDTSSTSSWDRRGYSKNVARQSSSLVMPMSDQEVSDRRFPIDQSTAQHLPLADHIIILDRHGHITEQGLVPETKPKRGLWDLQRHHATMRGKRRGHVHTDATTAQSQRRREVHSYHGRYL